MRKHYEEHNAHVKDVVAKEKLLLYRAEMGWGPLCDFLGKEAPDKPFPREAAGGQLEKQGKMFWIMALAKVTGKVGAVTVVGALGWYGVSQWLKRR